MMETFTPLGVGSEYSCRRSGNFGGHLRVTGKLERSLMGILAALTGPQGYNARARTQRRFAPARRARASIRRQAASATSSEPSSAPPPPLPPLAAAATTVTVDCASTDC